uniref:Spondin-like TSP1 domain-containing protein n=1 Tax=Timema genevievae TaxID=629358 RepID=A0A7R9PLP1_TIMGE|nr:unnamed protein product [Timema genevievae]
MIGLTAAILVVKDSSCQKERNHFNLELKEYELSEVFHRSEDERHYDVINMDDLGPRRANLDNNEIQTQIEEERREQEMALLAQQQHKTTTTIVPLTPTTSHSLASTPSSPLRDLLLPGGNKDAILNSIVQTYKGAKDQSPRKKYHGKFRKNMRKIRPPRDCRVSEWSPWSTCSKSCGIGEMQRQRQVLKHARRGGKVCPPLVENKWCGSARTCSQHYFDWKK